MIMGLPTSKQVSDFEAIEPGNYQVTLKAINLTIFKEYQSEKFNGGKGLRYQGCEIVYSLGEDDEGKEITYKDNFIKVSMNDKSRFFNRVSAAFGRDFGDDDSLEWKVNPKAETNHEYDDYFRVSQDSEIDGEFYQKGDYVHKGIESDGIVGVVDDLLVNGESIIGKECMLHIEINANGYNKTKAGAATPLPKTPGRRAPKPAAPAGAPL